MNKITNWWMTPKFPEVHLNDQTSFIKKWLFHPIKRRIARWYLKFLQRYTDIKVIGITGSAGKTSVKEFLKAILKIKGRTVVTVANIDPVYNIPTTILKTPFGTKYLVLEMGIEYLGEMDFYLWLAKPDVGIITNIFPTHLEYLKSIDGVAKEKGKLVESLDEKGLAILTSGDKNLEKISKRTRARLVWVKKANDPFTQDGYIASFTSSELGLTVKEIAKAIKSYQKPPHRLNWLQLESGALVLDDSYNSNPEAFLASLKMFIKKAGKNSKIAVIGDMLELGEKEIEYHKQIGNELSKYNFIAVIGVGNLSKHIISEIEANSLYTKTYLVSDAKKAEALLQQYLVKGFYIFVKGSHSIGLDKLVDRLV